MRTESALGGRFRVFGTVVGVSIALFRCGDLFLDICRRNILIPSQYPRKTDGLDRFSGIVHCLYLGNFDNGISYDMPVFLYKDVDPRPFKGGIEQFGGITGRLVGRKGDWIVGRIVFKSEKALVCREGEESVFVVRKDGDDVVFNARSEEPIIEPNIIGIFFPDSVLACRKKTNRTE